MKSTLSWALTLLGIGLLLLATYQSNQYLVQQATIKPSLEQLEQLGQLGSGSVDLQQTRALIEASSTAMIQSIVMDLILGLLVLAGGFWLAPKDAHHGHAH